MMLSSSIEKMMGKNLTKPPVCLIRNYSFKAYAKFFEKLIFPTGVTCVLIIHLVPM